MNLLHLPEEILLIIVKQLDLKTLYNLYYTCTRCRDVICMSNIIKVCKLSLTNMASVHTFRTDFFKNICRQLRELDLCAVSDLSKSALLPVVKKMQNLNSLHVEFTKITILDMCEVHEACPSIKDVGINFSFGKPKMTSNIISTCQNLFEKLENIELVGSLYTLLYSKLALHLFEKAKINTLKYIVAERECGTNYDLPILVEGERKLCFATLVIYLLNWKITNTFHGRFCDITPLSSLDLNDYEYFILLDENKPPLVYSSSLLKTFIKDSFDMDSETLDIDEFVRGNVVIMLWDKKLTNFDTEFYSNLFNKMKNLLVHRFSSRDDAMLPLQYDWYKTTPVLKDERDSTTNEPDFKKRRIAPTNAVLDYDNVFREKQSVQLILEFDYQIRNPITLSTNSQLWSKLTFLSLTGAVRYSNDFFNILFRCCNKLETLNVEASPISPCMSSITRSVPLSSSLKNLRCSDKRVDFNTMFSSFSQCGTLENIHILDLASDTNELANPTPMIEKCQYLYCLSIRANMRVVVRAKQLQLLNQAKTRFAKHHLFIELLRSVGEDDHGNYWYDPFLSVFRLNAIKPF